jgi:hypothetical protein
LAAGVWISSSTSLAGPLGTALRLLTWPRPWSRSAMWYHGHSLCQSGCQMLQGEKRRRKQGRSILWLIEAATPTPAIHLLRQLLIVSGVSHCTATAHNFTTYVPPQVQSLRSVRSVVAWCDCSRQLLPGCGGAPPATPPTLFAPPIPCASTAVSAPLRLPPATAGPSPRCCSLLVRIQHCHTGSSRANIRGSPQEAG